MTDDLDSFVAPKHEMIRFLVNPENKNERDLSICHRLDSKRLVVDKSYQRNNIASTRWKQQLVNSALTGILIPPIILNYRDKVYYIIDGQQRVYALYEFMKDMFSTHSHISTHIQGSKYYTDLPRTAKLIFDNCPLWAVVLDSATEDQERYIFGLYQAQHQLSAGEQIHALLTPRAKFVRSLAKNNALLGHIGKANKRFREYYIAGMAYSAITGLLTQSKGELVKKIREPASVTDQERDHVVSTLNKVQRGLNNHIKDGKITQAKIVYALLSIISQQQKDTNGKADLEHLCGYYDKLKDDDAKFGAEALQIRTAGDARGLYEDYKLFTETKPADNHPASF